MPSDCQQWQKLGLIYRPDTNRSWMQSHCQLPVADHIADSRYRVYFASRDEFQRSHVGYIEIDLNRPSEIIDISVGPVLTPGPIGHFDEHGVYPSSIVALGKRKYMYFIGWTRGYREPLFYASIGLAISDDGGRTFHRFSQAPIMDRGEHDPCLVTSPNVLFDAGVWRMTYVSGLGWDQSPDGELHSKYHIKYAESKDGISWRRDGTVAIGFSSKDETNIARPSVLKHGASYRMWYCMAKLPGTPYRLGYAESHDILNWVRMDAAVGIDVSENGFDNEMICYPHVVSHGQKLYMFYNGNGFGRDGIGLAILK
jgi:predicted GH43/DUF377 family glycosyl hydrolase